LRGAPGFPIHIEKADTAFSRGLWGEIKKAAITAHRDFTISNVDDRVYAAFLELLGRAIYSGTYEPGHPTADTHGMSGEMAQLVRDLNIPYVRYPGGNFVSAHNREDGILPRKDRPVRLDLAWHTSDDKARKRSRHDVTISFDEWNVWFHFNTADRAVLVGSEGWPTAPCLLEDIYNFEVVFQVGCILNTFIRKSNVVKIACIAQLVNVIAPTMTESGGAAWRLTIYHPLLFRVDLRARRVTPNRWTHRRAMSASAASFGALSARQSGTAPDSTRPRRR